MIPTEPSTRTTQYIYDAAGNTQWVEEGKPMTGSDGAVHWQFEIRRTWYNAAEQAVAVDRRVCQVSADGQGAARCDTTLALDYTDRPTFETYRYDALGRRILVRTRQDWNCMSRCMETVRRVVWDGSAIAIEVQAPGATGTAVARMEADTGIASTVFDWQHTPGSGFFTGRVVYVNGPSIDRPLALYRVEYSDSLPEPVRLLPVTNWQGHYDWQFGAPTCRVLTGESSQPLPPPLDDAGGDTIQGNDPSFTHCAQPQYAAAFRWVSREDRSRGMLGPVGWFGSVLEEMKDATGQIYQRNRYYDPASGRFTQEDPIGLSGGLNQYGFAEGDPVNFEDPLGLCPWCIGAAIGAAVGAAGTMWWNHAHHQPLTHHLLRNTLIGAGVGATLGLGYSALAARGATSVAAAEATSAATAAATQIPDGEFERTFETAAGTIRVLGEATTKGKTLIIDNFMVYPDNAKKLNAGLSAIRSGFRAIEQVARDAGYEQIVVNYVRTQGANPGKAAQKVIDLTQ